MTQTIKDLTLDQDGHLTDHTIWSQQIAQILADTIDVTLTDEHYTILIAIRNFYAEFKHPPATRPLIKYLQQQLPESKITNQKLQTLFNTGLVARHLNRIAGLPKPPNCL